MAQRSRYFGGSYPRRDRKGWGQARIVVGPGGSGGTDIVLGGLMEPEKMNCTVLVVDDDEDFLEEVIGVLDSSGYSTITVSDPLVASEEVERRKPNVVLLDLKMPGRSGLEVAYDIKRNPGSAHVPVVAMSAFFQDGVIPLAELCGIKKCLRKPFNPLDLIHAIESVLGE